MSTGPGTGAEPLIRLSRKTEYALLALGFLYGRPDAAASLSARDIAAHFRIPPAILAKVMQTLKQHGIVDSLKGVSGGYTVRRDLSEVSLHEILRIFENADALVDCLGPRGAGTGTCEQLECCAIRDPIAALNDAIQDQLRGLSLAKLFSTPAKHTRVPFSRLATADRRIAAPRGDFALKVPLPEDHAIAAVTPEERSPVLPTGGAAT
ncbi:MAG: Rrf2 family transcriptional regulator [Myxococcales bacterium]|nr:Rrf2 family transcriptional regulator [Myxococcales bacterium]